MMETAETEMRRILTRVLLEAGVFGLRDQELEDEFISGAINPSLKSLGIDSLSEMELCIGIENEWGISFSPIQLVKLASLDDVVRKMQKVGTA